MKFDDYKKGALLRPPRFPKWLKIGKAVWNMDKVVGLTTVLHHENTYGSDKLYIGVIVAGLENPIRTSLEFDTYEDAYLYIEEITGYTEVTPNDD